MPKNMNSKALFFVGLILIAVVSRWIPHAPNWTPILGLALFAGFRITNKWFALGVPLAAMVISDAVLGFHNTSWAVYSALALIALLPLLAQSLTLTTGIALSAVANIGFFAITNFAVWLSSGMYAKTLAGLWQAYVMALPFLTGTFASTILSLALFYGLERAAQAIGAQQTAIK